MASQSERNLLFVVFALQLNLITHEQLVSATNTWVRDKSQPIDGILLDLGALDPEEIDLIQRLVGKHLSKHGEDGERSLIAAGLAPASELSKAPLPNASGKRADDSRGGDTRGGQSLTGDFSLNSNPTIDRSLRLLAGMSPEDAALVDWQPIDEVEHPTEAPLLPGSTQRTTLAQTVESNSGTSTDFKRFTRLRDHAQGGLGVVCVAMDQQFNREVALKEIRGEYASFEESQQRFFQEAVINGGLEHPGIVPVYAMGRNAEGKPYYAMRFIRGESLKRLLRRTHKADKPERWVGESRGTLNRLLGHFIDACNAIAYAHSRGVIHRDIKPSNIMVGKFGETLVVDWGLAKSIGRDGSTRGQSDEFTLIPSGSGSGGFETRIGHAIGTPQYMSPEQACGNVSRIGVPSDIFNLGATLYELLTGKAPYSGEQFEAIENGDSTPPRQLNPTIDAALESICLKAMQTRPDQRYRGADELTEDLEAWLADLPVAAHEASWLEKTRRWMRRKQSVVAGLLAAMLVFVISMGVLALVINQSYQRLKAANEAQQIAQQDAERSAVIAREQSELALSTMNAIVYDLQDRLRDVPAASAARRQLLQTALDGLSRVSERIQLREGIAKNQAQALIELGQVFVSIGDDPELGTALVEGTKLIQRAVDIREELLEQSPDDAEIKRDLCRALVRVGEAREALGDTDASERSVARLMKLAQELVDDEKSEANLGILARALLKSGDFEGRTGSGARALEQYRAATTLLEETVASAEGATRLASVRQLVEALNRQGVAQLQLGDFAAASDLHQAALQWIDNELLMLQPQAAQGSTTDSPATPNEVFGNAASPRQARAGDARYGDLRQRAKTLLSLGKSQYEDGKLDEALQNYLAAFEIRLAAAKLDPSNAMVQSELANIHAGLGQVYLALREFELSIENYSAGKDIAVSLSAADPSSQDALLMVSQAHTNIAAAQFGANDLEQALRSHQRAREVSEQLVEVDPKNRNKLRDLAISWLNIGITYNRLDENSSAIDGFTKSIEVCERLYEIDPDDAQVHEFALSSFWYLADLYQALDERSNVLATYRRAVEFGDKVLKRNPNNRAVRASHSEIVGYFALYRGDLEAAAAAARDFAEAQPEIADNWYNAACIYALCATQAAERNVSEESALEENAAAVTNYQAEALTALQRSVEAGYDDFENLRDDDDLAELRDLPAFQELFPTAPE